jgi:hypothetical protein
MCSFSITHIILKQYAVYQFIIFIVYNRITCLKEGGKLVLFCIHARVPYLLAIAFSWCKFVNHL